MTGSHEALAFLAVLGAGILFEAIWYAIKHTNAVTGRDRASSGKVWSVTARSWAGSWLGRVVGLDVSVPAQG